MKILLVSSSSGSHGGGEFFLLYLAKALNSLGHSVVLWCSTHRRMDELADRFNPLGDVVREDSPNSYLDRRTRLIGAMLDRSRQRRIGSSWKRIAPDCIHLNKQTLEDGLDLSRAAKLSGIPWVSTIHITQSNRELGAVFGGLRDWLARLCFQGHAKISQVAVSDSRARALQDQIGREVDTIYNGVEEPAEHCRLDARAEILGHWGWGDDSFLVVCVARLVEQKNPMRFLCLAEQLRKRCPSAVFLWVGDGVLQESFEQNVASRGLEDVVKCAGWCDDPSLWLRAADLYLHPARYEGLPLAILEAMSVGLPCAISAEIAAEADVFNRENVIICSDGSDGWLDLVLDPDRLRLVGENARSLYRSQFCLPVMGLGYEKRYERLVREWEGDGK